MTTFAFTSMSSIRCQVSTCFSDRHEVALHPIDPTEMQSIRETDFECFASTGVNPPVTVFPNSADAKIEAKLPERLGKNTPFGAGTCPGRPHTIVAETVGCKESLQTRDERL